MLPDSPIGWNLGSIKSNRDYYIPDYWIISIHWKKLFLHLVNEKAFVHIGNEYWKIFSRISIVRIFSCPLHKDLHCQCYHYNWIILFFVDRVEEGRSILYCNFLDYIQVSIWSFFYKFSMFSWYSSDDFSLKFCLCIHLQV